MDVATSILIWVCVLVLVVVLVRRIVTSKARNSAKLSPEEQQIRAEVAAIEKAHVPEKYVPPKRPSIWTDAKWGRVNPALVCPHCQQKGSVRTKPVDRAKGVNGGKAIGALLTGGVSLLATGISREEKLTQAHCDNCTSTWDF